MTKITSAAAIARLQSGRRKAKGAPALKLAHTFKRSLFVFNSADSFIVSPADDELPAILGVCEEGTFDKNDLPENLKDWLNGLADEVRQFQADSMDLMPSDNWEERKSVAPLVAAQWSQGVPYNQGLDFGDGLCYVGCNSVALGQIMYYWGVKGYHRGCTATPAYKTRTKRYKVASLPPLPVFDYSHMTAKKPTTKASINAVSQLLEYIGKAASSDYQVTGTGAYPQACANAMRVALRMGDGVRLIESDDMGENAFDAAVYAEIAGKRPIYMAGYNTKNAHAFVCDGYDSATGRYHFNWGWGGGYNGWFLLSAITPYTKNYSMHKQAIVGIRPDNVLGDVNGDGSVSISDVMQVIGLAKNGEYQESADVDSDGKVTSADSNLILDHILGKKLL